MFDEHGVIGLTLSVPSSLSRLIIFQTRLEVAILDCRETFEVLQTFSAVYLSSDPGDISMYTSTNKSPFRNVLFKSS